MINSSQILMNSESKVIISKVPKDLEFKVKTCPRQPILEKSILNVNAPFIIWMYFHPLFVLFCLWSSEVQIIKYLSRSLRLRKVLCLFSCLSFGSIVKVAMICNTRGSSCPILFYVVYLFVWFYFAMNHIFLN